MSDGALEAALDGPAQVDDAAVGETAVGETAVDDAAVGETAGSTASDERPPGRKPARGAPYRGLASFEQGDAHLFFGREDVTERLVAAVADDADFHDLPLVLVGSSGAGKSSVLRAGLLPRLTGPAAVFEPTAEPLAALKTAQQYLSDTWPLNPKRPVLIVDQFETLFTACQDETLRHAFVSELCELAESRGAHVVIALRGDFYDRVIRYAELANALQYRQVVLGSMTADDVIRAITEPARQASLNVEAALVRLLLEDLTPQRDAATTRRSPRLTRTGSITLTSSAEGAYEPGALPLLSHAMLATWEKSHGGTLTVADYAASGRIRDAVARTAEAAYEALTQPERQLARRLFLHLVHVLDDAPPTRAMLALAELRDWGPDAGHVLDVFVGERMITVDADNARITHDALLTAWPRLHGWIDTGQAGLITRRRIADAARAWDGAVPGGHLALARRAARDRHRVGRRPRQSRDPGKGRQRVRGRFFPFRTNPPSRRPTPDPPPSADRRDPGRPRPRRRRHRGICLHPAAPRGGRQRQRQLPPARRRGGAGPNARSCGRRAAQRGELGNRAHRASGRRAA